MNKLYYKCGLADNVKLLIVISDRTNIILSLNCNFDIFNDNIATLPSKEITSPEQLSETLKLSDIDESTYTKNSVGQWCEDYLVYRKAVGLMDWVDKNDTNNCLNDPSDWNFLYLDYLTAPNRESFERVFFPICKNWSSWKEKALAYENLFKGIKDIIFDPKYLKKSDAYQAYSLIEDVLKNYLPKG